MNEKMNEINRFFDMYQKEIIHNWIMRLEQNYPNQYDTATLQEQGERYIILISDIQIPIEEHPIFAEYKEWCDLLFNKGIPIDHILKSSLFFREAFLEKIAVIEVEVSQLAAIISTIITRIDAFQATIYTYFFDHTRGKMELQDKLIEDIHADKLNLIGKMASSMAHEIRNPLTSIKGFLVLIRKSLPLDSLGSIEKYLDIIDNEFRNIEMQVTGFLSFSRKPIADEQRILMPLHEVIEKTLLLVNPLLLNENIELSLRLQDDLQVEVQNLAIIQVFSNLLNNAIDALRETDIHHRKITVLTFADGAHIYIRFINTGPEIPADIQSTLFDPFVTGKSDGTGLGLAICKQIVERNNGTITFETNRKETTFTLRFPALAD
ncbi:sensor histidine kinase [Paenibacillus lignilyticus]|uniref:histidine kinase n=1 Tax=Paenibacillus lignilyticus TaxID=1172615 RepID=A0ABS5CC51_9BACL|nr:HAMP domain-containing sensor histidine kinase [Paenibacillus lignilyticus]MBP3961757.1 HAMP domain-containing histidine kinase [Paenibacillus lignilyticus]MBP3963572.1 HAMP domain-containing histidine kinase [Paenibacillus lignilyticus]